MSETKSDGGPLSGIGSDTGIREKVIEALQS